ncbi:hypothetical protein L484_002736 [Morus notabilis]|uniref:Uncharacterized protein n=1 Tax=Morus notabilis TaxID=981085 RepID=W9QQI6_9ROSA|nr:hypothetical protein L484_002736 [Morus notabilis]
MSKRRPPPCIAFIVEGVTAFIVRCNLCTCLRHLLRPLFTYCRIFTISLVSTFSQPLVAITAAAAAVLARLFIFS